MAKVTIHSRHFSIPNFQFNGNHMICLPSHTCSFSLTGLRIGTDSKMKLAGCKVYLLQELKLYSDSPLAYPPYFIIHLKGGSGDKPRSGLKQPQSTANSKRLTNPLVK